MRAQQSLYKHEQPSTNTNRLRFILRIDSHDVRLLLEHEILVVQFRHRDRLLRNRLGQFVVMNLQVLDANVLDLDAYMPARSKTTV